MRDHVYCPSIQYKQSIKDKNSTHAMSSNSSVLIQTKMLSDYSNEMKGKIYYNKFVQYTTVEASCEMKEEQAFAFSW